LCYGISGIKEFSIMMKSVLGTVLGASLLLSGCSFVNISEKGERVMVLKPTDVAHCRRLGSTVVSVKDSIAGVDRSHEKMDIELEVLARNSAQDVGGGQGDTVVREERLGDGKQRFGVYRCRP
jgi:hypothetical protein